MQVPTQNMVFIFSPEKKNRLGYLWDARRGGRPSTSKWKISRREIKLPLPPLSFWQYRLSLSFEFSSLILSLSLSQMHFPQPTVHKCTKIRGDKVGVSVAREEGGDATWAPNHHYKQQQQRKEGLRRCIPPPNSFLHLRSGIPDIEGRGGNDLSLGRQRNR